MLDCNALQSKAGFDTLALIILIHSVYMDSIEDIYMDSIEDILITQST